MGGIPEISHGVNVSQSILLGWNLEGLEQNYQFAPGFLLSSDDKTRIFTMSYKVLKGALSVKIGRMDKDNQIKEVLKTLIYNINMRSNGGPSLLP